MISLLENKNFLTKIYDTFKNISSDKLKTYISDFFKDYTDNNINDEDETVKAFKEYLNNKMKNNREVSLNEIESFKTEVLREEESEKNIDLSKIQVHDELSPKFFDKNGKLDPTTRKAMLKVAEKYLDFLDIKGLTVEDIVFTGSLANKNYNEDSDIDIHIIVDYGKLGTNKDILFDYFKVKKDEWSDQYNITIHGSPVEIFVQDDVEPKEWTAVYSILNDEWVQQPELDSKQIDKEYIRKKVLEVIEKLDKIEDSFNKGVNDDVLLKDMDTLWQEVKTMRQKGLEKGGEFGNDNLVFKVLRNGKFLDKIWELKKKIIEKEYSIDENSTK